MKKTIPNLLTLVCLLVAIMGLSVVTAHAATVTGIVSSGNEYRYHEDKSPVSQWGPYTSNKLKYFTRNDTGETVPAYCMEPEVRSASGDLQYSSTSWSDLTWNQRYAVTLAMAYGYGGNYGFNMHPDCAQLATQAVVWEFVCGYRSPVYPYALYDTTCANLFHYAGDDVAVAYNIIIDRIMNHGKIPSFAVKYRNQLSDANAITLTWDGSKYIGTATDTNGVLPQYYFSTNISGVTVNQSWNTLTVTATKDAAAQLNGYISSDYGYSLDVAGTEAVLLEPSNGSGYQACAALTSLPDPVWAYIHFKVNIVEEKGSLTINKVDAETGKALAGVTYRLYDSAGKKVADVTTGADGKAVLADLPQGRYSYQEISAPSGYVVDNTKYQITITATALNITQKRTNTPAKASIEIVKVDADHKTPLQGAGFRLYDTSGKQVAEGNTDVNGKLTFSNLRLGSYTYKEFKAPNGYVLDDTAYSAVLNQNGQVLKVTRENIPVKGSIEVLKVDAETKQPLAGVVYYLFDADGNKVADGTTDATGKVTFSGLRLGKYAYQEISTVDGYVLDETKYDFNLTTANLNIKVTRENAPAKGSITVRKVDATGAPLAGAELLLETSADGKTWTEVGKITTDSTGIAKWENLKTGVQYRVTETKSPAGYTLLTEPLFAGTLDSSNRDVTITACNNAGFALPFTGGTGFTTYILLAALMLCMGVYFCKKSDFMKEKTK
ncbi:MAG: Cys-Gln thioester bond-forming surface protein [Firmicutes bacterium]|nr:Cys-Gln thioester bond-forming surface protein [Bacillota bacterium]